VPMEGGSAPQIQAANDRVTRIGRSSLDTLTVTAGSNNCGSYYNGSSYAGSSHYSGSLSEAKVLVRGEDKIFGSPSTKRHHTRMFHNVYFDSVPEKNNESNKDVTLYKEHANDDGICVEGSTTYYKYRYTVSSKAEKEE